MTQALFNGMPINLPNIPGLDPSIVSTVIAAAESDNPHLRYVYLTYYVIDYGLMQLVPAAPDGAPARFAKMEAASAKVIISWAAARIGLQPAVPPAIPPDPDTQIPLKLVAVPEMSITGPDGLTTMYACSGLYEFGCTTIPDVTKLKGGTPPWATIPGAAAVYNLKANNKGLYS